MGRGPPKEVAVEVHDLGVEAAGVAEEGHPEGGREQVQLRLREHPRLLLGQGGEVSLQQQDRIMISPFCVSISSSYYFEFK